MSISDFESANLKDNLDSILIGSGLIVVPEVTSTNDLAKNYLNEGANEGLVILADTQTHGRGRFGRLWHSQAGVGIYLSVVLKPQIEPSRIPGLTLMAGVAVVSAINENSGVSAKLKWPNDLLLNAKKVGGILCEYCPPQDRPGGIILGIGINTNQIPGQFPEDLLSTATSIRIENGIHVDRPALVRSLIMHLDQEYQAYLLGGDQAIAKKWSQHTDMFDRPVRVTWGERVIEGMAVRLDQWGHLVVQLDDGSEISLDSGEVTLQ